MLQQLAKMARRKRRRGIAGGVRQAGRRLAGRLAGVGGGNGVGMAFAPSLRRRRRERAQQTHLAAKHCCAARLLAYCAKLTGYRSASGGADSGQQQSISAAGIVIAKVSGRWRAAAIGMPAAKAGHIINIKQKAAATGRANGDWLRLWQRRRRTSAAAWRLRARRASRWPAA